MEVNLTDPRYLGLLTTRAPQTAGELAREGGLSPGAMTTAIDRWERAGYARRVRSDTDRRSVRVEPTRKMQQVSEAFYGPLVVEGGALFQRFSVEELTCLRDFLQGCVELQRKPEPPQDGGREAARKKPRREQSRRDWREAM